MDAILIVLTVALLAIGWLSYRAATRSTGPTRPTTTIATQSVATAGPPRAHSSTGGTTCRTFRGARQIQDSPPVLGGGGILVARLVPRGHYGRVVQARRGDTVELSLRLHNGSYGGAQDVLVSVPLPSKPSDCFTIVAEAYSTTQKTVATTSDPVYLVGRAGDHLMLTLVPDTTVLSNDSGRVIAKLADTISSSSAGLPTGINGGTEDFVNFRVRVS
jgi:hypothetical protein